jgi:biotin carboxyl carrier protein
MEHMNPWMAGLLTAIGVQAVVIGGFLYSTRSQKPEAAKPAAAAKFVAKAEKTKDPNIKKFTLIPKAAERLDIKTVPVRAQYVARQRIVEGEVLAPPEATVVTAPMAGIISSPERAGVAAPGTKLSAGQTVLRLTAPSPQTAQPDEVRLAATVARPASRMPTNGIPQRRGQKAAMPQPAPAEQLAPAAQPPEAPAATPEIPAANLDAPRDAVLVRVLVQPGQAVEAGQPLFEIADSTSTVVRVPFDGDVDRVARDAPARIVPISAKDAKSAGTGWTARATQAPNNTDPKEAAKALYYVVEEAGRALAPGQRVKVQVQLGDNGKDRLTIPYAALIYTPDGATWVYTSPEPLVYVRHRIKVDYIEGDLVVLSEAPPVGTAVVTDGSVELYGAEFKVGHGINF